MCVRRCAILHHREWLLLMADDSHETARDPYRERLEREEDVAWKRDLREGTWWTVLRLSRDVWLTQSRVCVSPRSTGLG